MKKYRVKTAGVHHVCLKVPDLYRTVKFYQEAIDAKIIVEWGKEGTEDHAFIMDFGSGDFFEIFESQKHFDEGQWQHVAVCSTDIKKSYQRAIDAGAKGLLEPSDSDIPTRQGHMVKMSYAYVRAPGGELLEFVQDR